MAPLLQLLTLGLLSMGQWEKNIRQFTFLALLFGSLTLFSTESTSCLQNFSAVGVEFQALINSLETCNQTDSNAVIKFLIAPESVVFPDFTASPRSTSTHAMVLSSFLRRIHASKNRASPQVIEGWSGALKLIAEKKYQHAAYFIFAHTSDHYEGAHSILSPLFKNLGYVSMSEFDFGTLQPIDYRRQLLGEYFAILKKVLPSDPTDMAINALVQTNLLIIQGNVQEAIWSISDWNFDISESIARSLENRIMSMLIHEKYFIHSGPNSNRSSSAHWIEYVSGMWAIRKKGGPLNSTRREAAAWKVDQDIRFNIVPITLKIGQYSVQLRLNNGRVPDFSPVWSRADRKTMGVSHINLFSWFINHNDVLRAQNFLINPKLDNNFRWVSHDHGLSFDHVRPGMSFNYSWNKQAISGVADRNIRKYSRKAAFNSLGELLTTDEIQDMLNRMIRYEKGG